MTDTQGTLFGDAADVLFGAKTDRKSRTFLRFHADNPKVYRLFVRYTKEAQARGRKPGAWLIAGRIRWYAQIETRGDPFKLNNNWIAYYARMFHHDHPDMGQVFELRDAAAGESH